MAQRNHPERCGTWSDVVRIVRSLYPDLLSRTYIVPPVHFNKVSYTRKNVPGVNYLSALVRTSPSGNGPQAHDHFPTSLTTVPANPQSILPQETEIPVRVQENDFRDDFAQKHVMHNLQAYANSRQEVMFILSRLNFGSYLNQPAYAAATAHLPRPSELDTGKTTYSNCEADVVFIHRDHGILIGKIKSVGRNNAVNKETIVKRIKQAATQLDKSAKVVRHILKGVASDLPFFRTIFLPYISSRQLRQILEEDNALQKVLCASLRTDNILKASRLCCCSDDISDPERFWDVTDTVLARLNTWVQHIMTGSDRWKFTSQQYVEIVAST
ncbi:uncharacterized protein [Littorina saxatilis]|uniref:uncharacterized protein n=1 Tax=Littorina saxatilis TaxID=31220 RepID=UPI0038B44BA0